MSRVVLKGELHSSAGDLEEEKDLVKEGFDTLVLEGERSESEFGWTEGWFRISLAAFFWITGRIYVSKEILVDLAEVQDTEVVYTREADSDILENTPFYMKVFSAALFYTLVPGSVAVGLVFSTMWGATVLFMGFTLPVLGIRIFNSRQSRGEKNRDKIMAEKIVDAVENGESVLAIVGESHLDGVERNLPDSIDPDVRLPAYPRRAKQHIKEVALPFFEMVLVLYSLYLLVSWSLIQITRFTPSLI